jgi:hypothetical protein
MTGPDACGAIGLHPEALHISNSNRLPPLVGTSLPGSAFATTNSAAATTVAMMAHRRATEAWRSILEQIVTSFSPGRVRRRVTGLRQRP